MNDLIKVYGIIYKATNLINNKIYIGQTRLKLKNRIKGHIDCKTSVLSKALWKYGFDNFKWKIIDSAQNKQELNYKEYYYINLYNSYYKTGNGYNIAIGGNLGNPTYGFENYSFNFNYIKSIYCYEEDKIFNSCIEAGKYINKKLNYKKDRSRFISRNIMDNCQMYTYSAYKYHWFFYDINKQHQDYIIPPPMQGKSRMLKCIDLTTQKTYNSLSEAAKDIKGTINGIAKAIKLNRKHHGHRWAFWNSNGIYREPNKPHSSNAKKRIICINDNKEFESVVKASEYYHLPRTMISSAISRHGKVHGKLFKEIV